MELTYRRLIFCTMHMVTCRKGDPHQITDEKLLKAMTVNENLHSLGLTLRPQDIGLLAASDSLYRFYSEVKELVPEMKAKPMYPNFPVQVMEIDEAQFRLHQMIHYFSTYELEWLTGKSISRGWLPYMDSTPKTKRDDRLLSYTVLELAEEEDSYNLCLTRILNRRERLTLSEKELVMLSLPHASEETVNGIRIAFKENLELLFPEIFEKMSGKDSVRILRHLCQHTGDVLSNAAILLKKNKYHFRTSQKRTMVKLLESYPAENLRENLMLSNTKRERNLVILRYLDFNIYARSTAHKKAVADLRNGTIISWEGTAKRMLAGHEEGALAYTAKRPGAMLRMLKWILSLGYDKEEIVNLLIAHAQQFSTQMLVKLLSSVRVESEETIRQEKEKEMQAIRSRYEYERFHMRERFFAEQERKREIDEYMLAFFGVEYQRRRHECEVERLNQVLASRLRELSEARIAKRYREEINECTRNLESHAEILIQGQKQKIHALENSIQKCEERIHFLKNTVRAYKDSPEGAARCAEYAECRILSLEADVIRMKARLADLKAEVRALTNSVFHAFYLDKKKAHIQQRYERIREEAGPKISALKKAHEKEIEKLDNNFSKRLEKVEQETAQRHARLRAWNPSALEVLYEKEAPEIEKELSGKEAAEIEAASKKCEKRIRIMQSVLDWKRILERLLDAHLESITTPLRGRKVYLDPGPFELSRSLMQTTDKSQDGTFVRSGFAWKIPGEAKRVRFFVYWNDNKRVDIDLHASVSTYSEENPDMLHWFHVGWNSEFRESGVCHSGDITHSDAAEYIDIDLCAPLRFITLNVDLFSGQSDFRNIDECFVGLMAVNRFRQNVKLYDPANCFFTHELKQETRFLNYGYIDVRERFVRFVGKPFSRDFVSHPEQDPDTSFYVQNYLDILIKAQKASYVDSPEMADVILTVGKSTLPNSICLIDNNFFLDANV